MCAVVIMYATVHRGRCGVCCSWPGDRDVVSVCDRMIMNMIGVRTAVSSPV